MEINLQGRQRGIWLTKLLPSVGWSGAHTGMGIWASWQVEGSCSGPFISASITDSRTESGIKSTSDIAPIFLQAWPFCSGVFRGAMFRPSNGSSMSESCFVWSAEHPSTWIAPASAIFTLVRSRTWTKPSTQSTRGGPRIGRSAASSSE